MGTGCWRGQPSRRATHHNLCLTASTPLHALDVARVTGKAAGHEQKESLAEGGG